MKQLKFKLQIYSRRDINISISKYLTRALIDPVESNAKFLTFCLKIIGSESLDSSFIMDTLRCHP